MTTLQKKEGSLAQDEEKNAKIQELREIIANAQETISSATQLLSAIQGTTPDEMPIHQTNETEEDGQTIFGYFDGQIMIGDDGKQYPVPANYASKSKLVEGDKLKLNITPDNKFVYKQIGPVQRNYLIGVVKKDAKGNFTIQTPDKEYQVLLAAATYFKIEEGDEVTLIIPQGKDTVWGAIENVLQKNATSPASTDSPSNDESLFNTASKSDHNTAHENIPKDTLSNDHKELTAIEKLEIEMEKEKATQAQITSTLPNNDTKDTNNDWSSDIEKLKQEAGIATN